MACYIICQKETWGPAKWARRPPSIADFAIRSGFFPGCSAKELGIPEQIPRLGIKESHAAGTGTLKALWSCSSAWPSLPPLPLIPSGFHMYSQHGIPLSHRWCHDLSSSASGHVTLPLSCGSFKSLASLVFLNIVPTPGNLAGNLITLPWSDFVPQTNTWTQRTAIPCRLCLPLAIADKCWSVTRKEWRRTVFSWVTLSFAIEASYVELNTSTTIWQKQLAAGVTKLSKQAGTSPASGCIHLSWEQGSTGEAHFAGNLIVLVFKTKSGRLLCPSQRDAGFTWKTQLSCGQSQKRSNC